MMRVVYKNARLNRVSSIINWLFKSGIIWRDDTSMPSGYGMKQCVLLEVVSANANKYMVRVYLGTVSHMA